MEKGFARGTPLPERERSEKIKPVGMGPKGEVYLLFCPCCTDLMIDVIYEDKGIQYPHKQCPRCLTIYDLASESREAVKSVQEIILAPRSKKWLKKYGDKHIRGAFLGTW